MVRRMSCVHFIAAVLAGCAVVRAQPDDGDAPARFQEAVALETDVAVAKTLRSVEELLAARQWGQAIDLLDEVAGSHDDTLVPISPGRYVNVTFYCNLLLSRLPAEGLAVYRKRSDPQVEQLYESAIRQRDEAQLRGLLRRAFASSYGDNALMQLGEWSWEEGDIDAARGYWRQLLPRRDAEGSDWRRSALRFPDSQFGPAAVRARLILCRLAEAEFRRAERELETFRQEHGDATGTLAGETGNLAEILGRVAVEARGWGLPEADSGPRSFAINARRDGRAAEGVDVGAELWSVPLPARERDRFRFEERRPALHEGGPLSYHPVLYEHRERTPVFDTRRGSEEPAGNEPAVAQIVLFNTADHIYAFNLRTGRPAWAVDENDTGILYPRPPKDLFPVSRRSAVGVPRFTMTVHDGKLFAKMGTPITSRSERDRIVDFQSELVCLDLAHLQGGVKWLRTAAEIDQAGAPWSFEGSPVAADGRVYVALRRSQPQTQSNVACFDAETGRLLWNRKVCAAVSDIGRWRSLITHNLLTLGAGRVYYSTDFGAIAALDALDGTLQWVVTYQSHLDDKPELLSDHTRQGLLPCLYHQGLVLSAPNDTDEVMGIDAQSGVVRWRQPVGDRIRHLLGVHEGKLIAGGNSLWALDVQTGRILWGAAENDPEFFGYGRGLIVGEEIWWPTRDRIEIRSVRTGHPIRRRPILLDAHSRSAGPNTGGNLMIAGDYLLVAQADRLVVYCEQSLPVRGPEWILSAVSLPARP